MFKPREQQVLLAVDLAVAMHSQLDFLPRTAKIAAPHPRLGAVERQVRHVVQRLEVQTLDQLLAAERVAGRAELHLQQPFLAGNGVEEPAVRFFPPAKFHHRTRVPIGFAE